jgi:hypothetical protein
MNLRTEYFIRYRKRLKRRARTIFANRCCACWQKENLEFSHREQCNLGEGRGSKERYADILNHPEEYLLFCHDCHREYDREKNKCPMHLVPCEICKHNELNICLNGYQKIGDKNNGATIRM